MITKLAIARRTRTTFSANHLRHQSHERISPPCHPAASNSISPLRGASRAAPAHQLRRCLLILSRANVRGRLVQLAGFHSQSLRALSGSWPRASGFIQGNGRLPVGILDALPVSFTVESMDPSVAAATDWHDAHELREQGIRSGRKISVQHKRCSLASPAIGKISRACRVAG